MDESAIEFASGFFIAALDKTSRIGCLKSALSGQTLTMIPTIPLHEKLAPNPDSPVWEQIARWDRRVWVSQLSWTRESRMRGMPWEENQGAEFIADYVKREVEKGTVGSAHLAQIERDAQRAANVIADGWGTTESLELLYFRGVRMGVEIGEVAHMKTVRLRYLADDVVGEFDAIYENDEGKRVWRGNVRRLQEPDDRFRIRDFVEGEIYRETPMGRTAPCGHDVLLMLAPIAEAFPPRLAHLEVQDDTIQLTIVAPDMVVRRLNISRQSGTPLSLQTIVWNGQLSNVTEVQTWRDVQGFAVPESVISYHSREDSPENYREKYALQAAAINEAVAPDALVFPNGAHVTDNRLSEEDPISYQISDGKLPTLFQLEKLKKRREFKKKSQRVGLCALGVAAAGILCRQIENRQKSKLKEK